jgi:predicted enzyme related to lactoylglutathione lyase
MVQFEGAYLISNEDLSALPVGDIERAVGFYTRVLGFKATAVTQDSATLVRDAATIGVVLDRQHDPRRSGSYYVEVSDVDALRQELVSKGARPGTIEIQQHDGKTYRVFFVRECDSTSPHDGYCFCFGRRTGT